MSEIYLKDLWSISKDEQKKYKINFHTWNGHNQPLDIFVSNPNEFHNWNTYAGNRRNFNRQYSLSVTQFYHESNNIWLFTGIYEYLEEPTNNNGTWRYKCKPSDKYKNFIGRLKLEVATKSGRQPKQNLETHYEKIIVTEILKEPYTGGVFPGYENICHSFSTLKHLWQISKNDWKVALENLQGIYLITDISNGKKYVGSAYGDARVWGRWNDYLLGEGHGGNKELKALLKKDSDHTKYFQFSLLEYWARDRERDSVIDRENYWKDVLCSRDYGYNDN